MANTHVVMPWEQIGERILLDGFRRVLSRRYRMPSGEVADWEILDDGRTVAVVAVTEDWQVVMVRQFRPGPGHVLIELPGGYVEPDEPIEVAAARELLEETGFEAASIELVSQSWLAATATNERYALVARGCRRVAQPTPDETEFLQVVELSMSAFLQHALSGQMTDVDIALRGLVRLGVLTSNLEREPLS